GDVPEVPPDRAELGVEAAVEVGLSDQVRQRDRLEAGLGEAFHERAWDCHEAYCTQRARDAPPRPPALGPTREEGAAFRPFARTTRKRVIGARWRSCLVSPRGRETRAKAGLPRGRGSARS